jgi:formate hydrogenlyase transcriptional activator
LQTVLRQLERVAPSNATVLLLGESGTGKELVASAFMTAVHGETERSSGSTARRSALTCPRGNSSDTSGARSPGAVRDRVGRFQVADGGTLFLDEVGEIPPMLQGKLLRVLQDGQFERLGEARTRRVDVRIIAATNRAVDQEVEAGRFRQDLYYRLSLFPIELPPLRDRKEDIALLASHFLRRASERLNRLAPRLTATDLRALQQYDWPRNVCELAHVIERALILTAGRGSGIRQAQGDARKGCSAAPWVLDPSWPGTPGSAP